ncbi:MAG TPA: TetR/AcrR family transcriptional regulator [Gemmataceae bacterium]|jgi:AcrR family transcriptional regulator
MTQTANEKKRRSENGDRRAQRQEQILETAVQLFAEHGYSDTDTQLLAEKLQVGKGTIYRYFPSKRELFLAAADRAMRLLRQSVDSSIEGIDEPFERIAVAIRAYLTFFVEHPEYVELLMQERAQFKDRKKPTYFEHREVNVRPWRELYRGLIDAGRIRDVPVDRIMDVIGCLMYGTMFTNYFIGQRQSVEAQAQDILDIVFHGILTDSERRTRAGTGAKL